MSFTLTEASKWSQNKLKVGLIEEIVKDSAVMMKLRFIDVTGNAYQYTRENSLASGDFYDPNEIISEETGDVTSHTAVLKILAGDADVDNFLAKTRSDKTDFVASMLDNKTKGIKYKFLEKFWYGDNATNSKEFDGLHILFNALPARTYNQGGALSVNALEDQLDTIRGGMPEGLFMPVRLRSLLTRYFRGKANVEMTPAGWGDKVKEFNEIPIFVDDHLTLTETNAGDNVTLPTGSTGASIFALAFGEDQILGLQNGGLVLEKIGQVQNKDSKRYRVKWYVGLALQQTIRLARAHGITNATVVD